MEDYYKTLQKIKNLTRLADSGIKASKAGTDLRNMLMRSKLEAADLVEMAAKGYTKKEIIKWLKDHGELS